MNEEEFDSGGVAMLLDASLWSLWRIPDYQLFFTDLNLLVNPPILEIPVL